MPGKHVGGTDMTNSSILYFMHEEWYFTVWSECDRQEGQLVAGNVSWRDCGVPFVKTISDQ